jgi:hypothetical protein
LVLALPSSSRTLNTRIIFQEQTPITETSNYYNQLYKLSAGFNTAQANLNMDVQLADGIRLNLVLIFLQGTITKPG